MIKSFFGVIPSTFVSRRGLSGRKCPSAHANIRGNGALRSVAEYLVKTAEFDELAGSASEPALKNATLMWLSCYRPLASERQAHCERCNQIGRAVGVSYWLSAGWLGS
jgi:hypothetical protein